MQPKPKGFGKWSKRRQQTWQSTQRQRSERERARAPSEAAEQAAKAAEQGIGHSTAWSHHCSHRSRCHAGPGPLSLTEDGASDSVDMGTTPSSAASPAGADSGEPFLTLARQTLVPTRSPPHVLCRGQTGPRCDHERLLAKPSAKSSIVYHACTCTNAQAFNSRCYAVIFCGPSI